MKLEYQNHDNTQYFAGTYLHDDRTATHYVIGDGNAIQQTQRLLGEKPATYQTAQGSRCSSVFVFPSVRMVASPMLWRDYGDYAGWHLDVVQVASEAQAGVGFRVVEGRGSQWWMSLCSSRRS